MNEVSTTSAFDQILRGMYMPETPHGSDEETEWDPSWYSTD
ncbi:hypothetical protein BH09ACT1_BH09ACT1_04940 [soil metagenome]